MQNTIRKEIPFQKHMINQLEESGYLIRKNINYNHDFLMDTELLIEFIKNTQLDNWNKLLKSNGEDTESVFIKGINKFLNGNNTSTIDVLKQTLKIGSIPFKLMYEKPNTQINTKSVNNYKLNKLSLIEEFTYQNKSKSNRIDIVLFMNGIPFITMELKGTFNQSVEDAITQYKEDRSEKDKFLKRCIVHFAVSDEKVYMTTKLQGEDTFFLPFNKGIDNPIIEGEYNTSYLYNDVLKKDKIITILSNYIFKEEKKNGFINIFPRYHQLEVADMLFNDVKLGNKYLIQHSAGSGKTKTIGWLAHLLRQKFTLNNDKMFDSVIIVSDRKVVDKQLGNQIMDIEKNTSIGTEGLVVITKKSSELQDAIENNSQIIVTTIHKFSYILDTLSKKGNKNYAIIIDEAHSSQNGEHARNMKEGLSNGNNNTDLDIFDNEVDNKLYNKLHNTNNLNNTSFFAFTATPTEKTLEVFGTQKGNTYNPYHEYTMYQAEKEGFILNVLDNYVTYNEYYKLEKTLVEDPEYDAIAKKELKQDIKGNNMIIKEKVKVIGKHFMTHTINKIHGKGKAMIVSSSRREAIIYKLELDKWLKSNGYKIKTLVAFSGEETYKNKKYTENQLNKINGDIADVFSTEEFKILIVANKYQTGFDEPLLHTMYIDKKLSGIVAVQTLLRADRVTPGKEDTLIMDFKNSAEDIVNAFKPYYEHISLEGKSNPDELHSLYFEILNIGLVQEVDLNILYKTYDEGIDQIKLQNIVGNIILRYGNKSSKLQSNIRGLISKYIKKYIYLSQLVNIPDIMLEKLYISLTLLQTKLPTKNNPIASNIIENVRLKEYKLSEGKKNKLILKENEEKLRIKEALGNNYGNKSISIKTLSQIIDEINEEHALGFSQEHIDVLGNIIYPSLVNDKDLMKSLLDNSKDNFKQALSEKFDNKIVETTNTGYELYRKLGDNKENRDILLSIFLDRLYDDNK